MTTFPSPGPLPPPGRQPPPPPLPGRVPGDGPPGPPARLVVGTATVTPGQVVEVPVSLTNDLPVPATYRLSHAGLDPAWARLAEQVGPLAPGETRLLGLELRIPAGHPPASLPATLTASLADGAGAGLTVRAELRVVIGDGSAVVAHLEPFEVRGPHGGRVDVVLANRGRDPLQVELTAITPNPAVELRFAQRSALLHPGAEVRVRTRVRASRPVGGGTARRPFGVRVQGRSTPVVLEGTLVQRPLLAPWLMKAVALVAVVAVWVAVAIVGISALSHHVHTSAAARAAASAPPVSAPGGPSAGSAGAGAGGAGPSAPGPSPGAAASFGTPGAPGTDRVGGRVSGPSPGGVTVTLAPTSLASTPAAGAVVEAADVTGAGMVWAQQAVLTTDAAAIAADTGTPTLTTRTAPDGSWAFAGLRAPDTFLVTFTKAGFETAKYVVTTTTGGQSLTLDATLTPGVGSLSGEVTGPAGALGDVSVTVADGPVSITTTTPSTGPGVGTWRVGGLSTPGTYLVTADLAGFGTQTTTVTLGPGGSATGVDLHMTPGVATISGTVFAADQAGGVGGISVTASDATTRLSTTTLNVGEVGHFTLPNLPIPATYDLTVAGEDYQTETEKVVLDANRSVSVTVTSATADVRGEVATAFPVPSNSTDQCPGRENPSGALSPVPAAGVTLTGPTQSFKTLTSTGADGGFFDFGAVPVGRYLLSASEYCYETALRYVDVVAGAASDYRLVLAPGSAASEDTATVTGTVVDEADGTPVSGVPIWLDNGAQKTTSDALGTYTFTDVSPGLHSVAAVSSGCSDVTAGLVTCGEEAGTLRDFQATGTTVDVALGGFEPVGTLELPDLDTLSGSVVSEVGSTPITGASVTVSPVGAGESPAQTVTTTGTDGSYSFGDLLRGSYELSVTAPGYQPVVAACPSSEPSCAPPVGVTLALDQNSDEPPIALVAAPVLHVAVEHTSGSGFAGACVVVSSSTDPTVTLSAVTSSAGTASIPAEPTYPPTADEQLTAGTLYTVEAFDLASGTATVPADCTQNAYADQATFTAPPVPFVAEDNNSTVTTVVLTPVLEGVSVALDFPYAVPRAAGAPGNSVTCPLQQVGAPGDIAGQPATYCPGVDLASLDPGPSVILQGINTSGQAVDESLDAPSGADNDWTLSGAALDRLNLSSDNVTVAIDGGAGFSSATLPVSLRVSSGSSGSAEDVTAEVTPTPSVFSGSVSGAGSGALTVAVDPASVAIPAPPGSASGGGTASIDVSEVSTGGCGTDGPSLEWVDSSEPGGQCLAEPGLYELNGTGAGLYQQAPLGVLIGACPGSSTTLCPGAPSSATLVLHAEDVLTVSLASSLPASGVDATVTLAGGTTSAGALTVVGTGAEAAVSGQEVSGGTAVGSPSSDGQVELAGSADQAVFSYLDPLEAGPYTVIVSAPGAETWFSAPFTLPATSGGDLSVTGNQLSVVADPTTESAITGTVEAALLANTEAAGLGGADVAATYHSGSCPVPANLPAAGFVDTPPASSSAVTAGDGAFSLSGDPAVTVGAGGALSGNTNGGLCAPDVYSLEVSAANYVSAGPQSATVGVAQEVTLQAPSVDQEIDVSPSGGGAFPAGSVVELSFSPAGGPSSDDGSCSSSGRSSLGTSGVSCTVKSVGSSGATTEYVFELNGLAPTGYSFEIQATDAQAVELSGVAEEPNPQPLVVELIYDSFQIAGTVTAQPQTSSSPVAVPGVGLELLTSSGAAVATTTSAGGGAYAFSGVGAGSYQIVATTPGYQVSPTASVGSEASVVTGSDYEIDLPLTATLETPEVTVTVSSSVAGAAGDLAGATVQLREVSDPGGSLPATCSSQSGSGPLLVAGLGAASYSGSVSGDQASLGQVVPDFYQLSVSNPTGGMPVQAPSSPVAICPGSSASLSFSVVQGELTGTVTEVIPPGTSATTPTIGLDPYPASASAPVVTESSLSAPTGSADGSAIYTWSAFVPTGTEKVTVAAPGDTDSSDDAAKSYQSVTVGSTTSATAVATTLTPTPVTVSVRAVDISDDPLGGASVALSGGPSGTALPVPATTGSDGTVSFELAPALTTDSEYTATATYSLPGGGSVTTTTSFEVPLSTASAPTPTLDVPVGTVDATITLSGASPPSSVTLAFSCSGGTCHATATETATAQVGSGGVATFSGEVPAGDNTLTVSATGYTPATVKVSVPDSSVAVTLSP